MTKRTNKRLGRMNDDDLCARCDDLARMAATCRQRRWTRKLEQVLDVLRQVTTELGRRIKRDEARRV
jgi:hypothetical protein